VHVLAALELLTANVRTTRLEVVSELRDRSMDRVVEKTPERGQFCVRVPEVTTLIASRLPSSDATLKPSVPIRFVWWAGAIPCVTALAGPVVANNPPRPLYDICRSAVLCGVAALGARPFFPWASLR
jgi:hypothetical protein